MVWPKPVGQQEARREWLGLQGTGTSFLLPCTLSCLARMPRIAEVAPGPCTQEEGPAEPGDEISWVCSGGGRGEAVNHLGNPDTSGLPHQWGKTQRSPFSAVFMLRGSILSRGLKRLSVDPRTQMSLREEIVNCYRFPSWDWSVNQPAFSAVQPSLHNLSPLPKKHCPERCINLQASKQQKASKYWF